VKRELLGADNVDQRRQRLRHAGRDRDAEVGVARLLADRDQPRASVASPRTSLATGPGAA
jgi:hypothetical protein